MYNVYASTTEPVDCDNPANLIAVRLTENSLKVPPRHVASSSGQHRLYYAVATIDRYGLESRPTAESTAVAPHRADIIPNDGRYLMYNGRQTDDDCLVACSLQGTMVRSYSRQQRIDISLLPEGIYQLKSLNKKGVTHRLGFFIVKRKQ
ncbi:MAG: hypothetical protein IJ637_09395, partial [Prevotella sp.]|nr:hypothetical protein [Prevotella sp.]